MSHTQVNITKQTDKTQRPYFKQLIATNHSSYTTVLQKT